MSHRHLTWILLLATGLIFGCGKQPATVTTEGDTTTVTADTNAGTTTATTTTDGDNQQTTIEGPEGTTEVTKEGDTTTVTSDANGEQVSMTHQEGGSALTADDIGVEFYPGAEATLSNVWTNGNVTTRMVQLTSSDDPDKIQAFYKKQLGKVMSETTTEQMRTLIKVDGKIHHTIAIETADGVSKITISRVENATATP